MKEIEFKKKYSNPITLALGFFDCIHIGHAKIIKTVCDAARSLEAESAVFTFENNPFEVLHRPIKLVYDYKERLGKLKALGVDIALRAHFSESFMNISREDFLKILIDCYDIKLIACGEDYRFGKNHNGDVELLHSFCAKNSIELRVVPTVLFHNEKAASTSIRSALSLGDISFINDALSLKYTILGVVTYGKGNGNKLGFPTINFNAQKSRQMPKQGVYKTTAIIEGVRYRAITNVGERPTFSDEGFFVETHILNFSGNLYGKEVVIEFERFIRDICRFDSKSALSEQIAQDIKNAYGTIE